MYQKGWTALDWSIAASIVIISLLYITIESYHHVVPSIFIKIFNYATIKWKLNTHLRYSVMSQMTSYLQKMERDNI